MIRRIVAVTALSLVMGVVTAIILFVVWLHASPTHVTLALRYLLFSGIISIVAWILALVAAERYAPTLGVKLALAALIGSVAAIINVLVTPLLMFAATSDKILLVISLIYFLAITLGFAAGIGVMTARRLRSLREGAARLSAGDFETRVDVEGADEVAELARAFNRMSAELGTAFERQRQLEQERRDLLAAVSHDLRTPLTSIRAMVEAINDGIVREPDEVRRYLDLVQQETEHLGRLIEDLFELTRIESGSLELRLGTVPVDELIAETVDVLRLGADEKGVAVDVSIAPDLPPLTADAARIQRVVINLIQNAVRHTPPGGRVDVRADRLDGHVRLVVEDTGEGISPEDQLHIFERFYRGEKSRSREGGGAGLGLAIARGIVEAHQGSIAVESTPGTGARFVVIL